MNQSKAGVSRRGAQGLVLLYITTQDPLQGPEGTLESFPQLHIRLGADQCIDGGRDRVGRAPHCNMSSLKLI